MNYKESKMNVNKEQAIKLKELGFDVPTKSCYYGDDKDIDRTFDELRNHNSSPLRYSAPTLHEATDWLRETKGLHVCAMPDSKKWIGTIWDISDKKINRQARALRGENTDITLFDTHDTALSAAITHAISLLTNKNG